MSAAEERRKITYQDAAIRALDAALIHLKAEKFKLRILHKNKDTAGELFVTWVQEIRTGLHEAPLSNQLAATQFFVQRQALEATAEAIKQFVHEEAGRQQLEPITAAHILTHAYLIFSCQTASAHVGVATSGSNTMQSIGATAIQTHPIVVLSQAYQALLGPGYNDRSRPDQGKIMELGKVTNMRAVRHNLAIMIVAMECQGVPAEGKNQELRRKRANRLYLELLPLWSKASDSAKRECEEKFRVMMRLVMSKAQGLPDTEAYWAPINFLKHLDPNYRESIGESSTRDAIASEEEAEHSLLKPRMARRHLAHYFGVGTTQEDWQRARRSNRW
ncbi:hypothetical protein JCM11641_004937 [Rhodosporidiobolus odoratus]